MAADAKEVYKRWDALKEKRNLFDQHWQEITDYFLPNKNTITREASPGEKRMLHIYDSTGIHANKTLAAMLHGVLTNPTAYWFEFTTGVPELDKLDAVRKWLQTSSRILHEIMNNSNFQTEIHELYMDLGSIGTAAMSIEEDEDAVVRFSSKPMKDIWVEENSRGVVDVVFHSFKWKPRQVVQEFGKDKTPKFVLDKMKSHSEDDVELLQVVCPNMDYMKEKKLSVQGKKYLSCTYVSDGSNEKVILKEAGFDTFPFIVPRWSKGSGEVYGRSPAMECLAEAKMINEMMKETIRAQQKATNPPLLVPDDGIVGSLRLTPGGINYYRSGSGDFIKPLQTEVNLVLSFQMLDDVRKRIRDCFFWDQMQLKDGPQMTATEVMQRNEDNVRLMGPVLGRQHSESGRPTIERVYEIADRRKLLPPPPRELSGRKIDVKYRSMLAKAQLATEAQNLARVFQAAGPFFQIDPKTTMVVNAEEGVRYVANLYGLPVELIRDKAELEAMQQAQDEANQAALQAQQEQAAVDQVAAIAPAAKMAHEMGNPRQ